MKKIITQIPSIIFNITEVLVVILIGKLLGLSLEKMLIIMVLFAIIRMNLKGAIHYKDWRKCFVMTSLFFLSLFVVAKVDFILGVLITVFEASILTGNANINDIFMWGGNRLNKEVFNWVKFNQDNEKLMKYEKKLKDQNERQKYFIFKYRFREFKSYNQIAELMEMDVQRVSDEIKIMSHFIEYSIRLDD